MARHNDRDPRERILERCYPYQLLRCRELGPCMMWPGAKRRYGYGAIRIKGRKESTHKVMLERVIGRKLRRNEVALHLCDNPPCCEPSHLKAGLQRTNMRDKVRKGRHRAPNGEAHNFAKYSKGRICVLKDLHATGVFSPAQLSALCGMPISTVRSIISGRRWKALSCR